MSAILSRPQCVNSWAPGRYDNNFKSIIFKSITQISSWCTGCEIALGCMPQNLTVNIGSGNGLVPLGNKPSPEPMLTLVYAAVWCHYATMIFFNDFSTKIQIHRKFQFVLIQSLLNWLLQNFVHEMTALLSWQMFKSVAISWSATESMPINYELTLHVLKLILWNITIYK